MITPEHVWDFFSWALFVWFLAAIFSVIYVYKRGQNVVLKTLSIHPIIFFCVLIIWVGIYILLPWSAYRVWMDGGWDNHTIALLIFVVNMLITQIWILLFYCTRAFFICFIWSIIICIFAVANFIAFIIIDLLAGLLFIPFVIMIFVRACLTYYIHSRNLQLYEKMFHEKSEHHHRTHHGHCIGSNLPDQYPGQNIPGSNISTPYNDPLSQDIENGRFATQERISQAMNSTPQFPRSQLRQPFRFNN